MPRPSHRNHRFAPPKPRTGELLREPRDGLPTDRLLFVLPLVMNATRVNPNTGSELCKD